MSSFPYPVSGPITEVVMNILNILVASLLFFVSLPAMAICQATFVENSVATVGDCMAGEILIAQSPDRGLVTEAMNRLCMPEDGKPMLTSQVGAVHGYQLECRYVGQGQKKREPGGLLITGRGTYKQR
ncbi:MAG: hypothetical protein Q8L37_06810 [Candidatus Gottesmanbacteria bacterium]|nr:hypothetical protein [Candidatus Gottesmanbacteria bacterium]